MLKFSLNNPKNLEYLHNKTDLVRRYEGRDASFSGHSLAEFCDEVVFDEASALKTYTVAYRYYDEVDTYDVLIMEYPGVYFVILGPENEPIGYFFDLNEATETAEQYVAEVYDEQAENELKENNKIR